MSPRSMTPMVDVAVGASDGQPVETSDLVRELRDRIDGEVRFDQVTRGAYARDASNYRLPPVGVVVPRSAEDVVATLAVCRERGVPVLGRGGGTSLAGQCCNTAVVIDFTKHLNRVLDVDPEGGTATVEPGLVLDDLNQALEPHGLIFGPDPATHSHCTLGGMIGNNACGVHALWAGRTSDNVEAMHVVTYDAEEMTLGPVSEHELRRLTQEHGRRADIHRALVALRDKVGDEVRRRFPDIPRRVSGYNLDELLPEQGFNLARALVGTESTCALTLSATVRVLPEPAARILVVLGYPDVFRAGDHVPQILEYGPIGLEGLDHELIENERQKGMHPDALPLLPEGRGYLMVEFAGDSVDEAEERARQMIEALEAEGDPPDASLFDDPEQAQLVWDVRESGLGATARSPGRGDTWPGWEDSAVPPEQVGGYLRDLQGLFDDFGVGGALYGHFGDGCIHTRIDFDLKTADGVKNYRDFVEAAADRVIAYGGSLSGEHGDGQARGELLERMFGADLVAAFRAFKHTWDPDGKMNPGKVVDARPLDADLTLGASYRPQEPDTEFGYPDDDGRFSRAALRCVGVGKCRKEHAGTMCPSYQVTREEIHSTRGRARLLHEMLQGDVVEDGWRSDAVHEALDLCLACKGCYGECPVNVDMATYKAEFLSHRYRRRLRPMAHYSMGLIPMWARVASKAPRLVNCLTRARGLSALVKRSAGLTPGRPLPEFAGQTFRSWFAGRRAPPGKRPDVLLWPDTFTNFFDPGVGRAAVGVLEQAGLRVRLPETVLCCALPMITTGMLGAAKRFLQRTIEVLRSELEAGTPIVGLEPSCTAVFRHDLTQLFPHDEDARRLRGQVVTLGELLDGDDGWRPPALEGRVLVQGHCHQKAVMGMEPDRSLLAATGLDVEMLDSGCCGLAGSFGFEKGHHDVSMACAERVLAPAVRAASSQTMVVADGFSCRTQVAEATDRHALHLSQVLALGLDRRE